MTGPVTERPMGWVGARIEPRDPPRQPQDPDLRGASRAVRRQVPLVALCAAIGAAIAVAMILGSIPRYRAVETVLLDEERSELLEQVSPIPNALYTNSAIQSELEIIKSKELALRVVDRIDLHEDEAFMNPPISATERVIGLVGLVTEPLADLLEPEPAASVSDPEAPATADAPAPDPERAAMERAASLLQRDLSVNRVGSSFVIQIGYEGYSPERVHQIARAYGQSYQTYQLDTSREVAANAGEWIEQRLAALEDRSLEAAEAVERFRSENGLVQVRGNLLSEQQLSEMASELIQASADTAQVGARLDNLRELQDASPAQALSLANLRGTEDESGMFSELRREYLSTRRRYISIVDSYGEDHRLATGIQATLTRLESVIAEELDRATQSVQAEFEIAQRREQSLREDLQSITDVKTENIATLGRLSQLEAVAETYQAVYRDYLQRYELTTQQQAFPIASVKVISEAELPRDTSSPQKKKMLASGLFLGLLFGGALGAIRELGPRRLRTRDEVVAWLGLPCAGLMPRRLSPRGQDRVARQTALRLLQALEPAVEGGRMVTGFAPAISHEDPMPAILSMCRAARHDFGLRPLVVDARGLGDRARQSLSRKWEVEIVGPDRLATLTEDGAPGAGPGFVVIAMPALTEMGGVDRLSRLCRATILSLPWGRVRPDLVEDALSDHGDFRARLATTVVDGARLATARRYMSRGNYEEQVLHA